MLASTNFLEIAWNVPEVGRFAFANRRRDLKIPSSDGGRSSMVEPQIVILVVAGSSPVDHPAFALLRRR